jgi:hypothetical protein
VVIHLIKFIIIYLSLFFLHFLVKQKHKKYYWIELCIIRKFYFINLIKFYIFFIRFINFLLILFKINKKEFKVQNKYYSNNDVNLKSSPSRSKNS